MVWDPLDILIQDIDYGKSFKDGAATLLSRGDALVPLRMVAQHLQNVGQCVVAQLSSHLLADWIAVNGLQNMFCKVYDSKVGTPRQQLEAAMLELNPMRILYVTSAANNLKILRPEQIRERKRIGHWKECAFVTAYYAPREYYADFCDVYQVGKLMKHFLSGADVIIKSSFDVYRILKDGFKETISE